ncbi:MAG: hypothetical protein H6842_02505 [Rhodospirillaceae bacterium]|nr:hypothetical protein [Rhodospirillaceae bacterium]
MPVETPEALLLEVRALRQRVADEGAKILARWEPQLTRTEYQTSAANLAHYLALRRVDLRPIQTALQPWGLSSLGRCEGRVMPTLDAILANLETICHPGRTPVPRPGASEFLAGPKALAGHTDAVLGPPPRGRLTRILVTLSPKAAKHPEFAEELLDAGMDCARINCSQDDAQVWAAMIANIRAAAQTRGRDCRILMDLGGPKIRTSAVLTPGDRNTVEAGDRILLTFGEPDPALPFAFQASCATPEALRDVKAGQGVSLKDGLIAGTVEEVRPEGLVMAVTRTPPEGQPLAQFKGINFPDTELRVSPLTGADYAALDFAAEHADIVGYSFVQRPSEIVLLQDELDKRRPGLPPIPIVAKVETKLAFANLPDIIVHAAGRHPFGVMIARGDLAVEIGYERLSEVQEEILWLCEAAHVPVIWATQVLESLVKRGMPSRGEFTDAAMATRAECVMLNKGRHITEGIRVLDNVLRRMEAHQFKKSPQLRPLAAWAGVR